LALFGRHFGSVATLFGFFGVNVGRVANNFGKFRNALAGKFQKHDENFSTFFDFSPEISHFRGKFKLPEVKKTLC
jgi:hypothetical protein